MLMESQNDIDHKNREFWNELCGTAFAKTFPSTDAYDAFFLDFYPYLSKHIDFASLKDRDVLEVGLGYGTVAEQIMAAGARYTGLDIAEGPVKGANYRAQRHGFNGRAQQGSILSAPFPEASFDAVIAIGCYHHTGNLPRAIAETRRILRKGGVATIMVYNALSYLQWLTTPALTARYLFDSTFRNRLILDLPKDEQRQAFDMDTTGAPAPETAVVSSSAMRRLLRPHFSQIQVVTENFGRHRYIHKLPRPLLLKLFGPLFGLDLYCKVVA